MQKTLDGIFTPQSVAVVGASPNPSRFGGRIVHSLVVNEFPGTIFPVNPKYEEIAGNRCYPSVAAIEDQVDLAILTVSEKQVMPTLEDCAAKGVKLAVLFGAGYAETGEQGELAQEELRELSERTGLRLLGPNCVGFLNVWDRVPATPAGAVDPPRPRKGGISIIAQSGFVGMETIFGRGYDAGYGFRYVITTGNEADLEAGELIAWLAEDEGTEVIVAYLEGIRDPERFREAARLAREAGKPIVILKGGRSPGGERSARSHTAALAVSDSVLDAVCEAEGIIRVTDLDDLWDVAGKLADGLRLAGPRVAVVGTSGGINTIFADDLRDVGLEMPELEREHGGEARRDPALVRQHGQPGGPHGLLHGRRPAGRLPAAGHADRIGPGHRRGGLRRAGGPPNAVGRGDPRSGGAAHPGREPRGDPLRRRERLGGGARVAAGHGHLRLLVARPLRSRPQADQRLRHAHASGRRRARRRTATRRRPRSPSASATAARAGRASATCSRPTGSRRSRRAPWAARRRRSRRPRSSATPA